MNAHFHRQIARRIRESSLAPALLAPLAVMVCTLGSARSAPAAVTVERGAIRSFDGTPIVYNLFLPDGASASSPVPIIFQDHGWGGSGQTSVGGFLQTLLQSNYAVLTWDSRGFGDSGGEAEVDSPDFEAKDASALIDFVGERPEILCEGNVSCGSTTSRDPRLGFEGGSYAGGIQLVTAAFDRRVDAIVPDITWHDLRYSLYPGNVIKLEWDEGLYGLGLATATAGGLEPSPVSGVSTPAGIQTGSYPLELNLIEAKGTVLGYPDKDSLDWFKSRSVAGYGDAHPVRIPTMLTQGICDTLFNGNEALANYQHVLAHGAPAKIVLKKSGHSSCSYGDDTHVHDLTLAWLDRYVKNDISVDTGAPVEYLTNDGVFHSSTTFPPPGAGTVKVSGGGMVVNSGAKSSLVGETPATFTAVPSGASDPGTLTIDTGIVGDGTKQVVGVPHAKIIYSGDGLGTHLFFKLVDREANQVLDLQEAALRVDGLGSGPESAEVDLVAVAYVVPSGHHIDLQIATSSNAMSEYRSPSVVALSVSVDVPML